MEKVTLKFICKNHCYSTIVFDNYAKAVDYLARNPQPLGTTQITITF